jgi:hypothetical protein
MASPIYHPEITEKLQSFIASEKIPNIIFHGPSGSGKRTLVHTFVSNVYNNNKELMKSYVMNVNCAHGKGIKFVREDLKFFAKTHINIQGSGHFKTVILSNADNLTTDAQSALRRCIELFSHTTRFFIIVEDKYKLLKPILSRLCEIFVAEPIVNGQRINLYKHALQQTFNMNAVELKQQKWLRQKLLTCKELHLPADIIGLSNLLYEKSYSGLDLMQYLEASDDFHDIQKYQMLLTFHKVKREFRNEKLFMFFILYFLLVRSDFDLENISFM